jgi:hypothetical protein
MKKILIIGLLFASMAASAQRITEYPIYTGAGDSVYTITVVNGANRKMYGVDLSKARMDSVVNAVRSVSGGVPATRTITINGITYDLSINRAWNVSAFDSSNTKRRLDSTATALAGKQATITATTSADYYRGDKSFQPLNKAAVGLGSVVNTDTARADIATALNARSTVTALNTHLSNTSNPHSVTKAQVGLGNVINTDTARTDIAGAINLRLKISDTAAMFTAHPGGLFDTTGKFIAYQNAINARVKYTDTSGMLTNYRNTLSSHTSSIAINTASIPLKVNISDTSAMLSAYRSGKLNVSDTAGMLGAYRNAINTNTTAIAGKGRVDSIRLVNTGLIYTTPAAFSLSGNTGIITQALANQSPYTLLGRASGTGVPSFLPSIDSNWVPNLHSQNYYNTVYQGIGNYKLANDSVNNISGFVTRNKYTTDSANTKTRIDSADNAIALKLNKTDTAAMLAPYRIDSVTKYFMRSMQNMQHWIQAGTSNGITFTGSGMSFSGLGGTATARSISSGAFTQYSRVGVVATSAAGAVVGYKNSFNNAWFGNAAGQGGFDFSITFGNSSVTATDAVRGYVAMTTTTGTITTEPSAGTNFFGFAYSSGGTNWKIFYNDGSGTADSIDLGSNFPTLTTSSAMYKFQLSAPGNQQKFYYQLTNLSTGAVANGSVITNIPTSTTFFGYQFQLNSAAITGAPALDFVNMYFAPKYGLTGNVGNILNY